ncbi:MAG: PAS domain-containing protein [Bauldia litoralis]
MEEWFRDPRLFQLYQYWQSKKAGGQSVRRADIDFAEILALLPILHILEINGEPGRFRHRFVGTEIVEALGRDVTGRDVDGDLYGDVGREIAASLARVAQDPRPYRRIAHLTWHEYDWLEMESVELPMVDDEGRVVALLSGATFHRREPGSGPRLVHEPLPVPDGREHPTAVPD